MSRRLAITLAALFSVAFHVPAEARVEIRSVSVTPPSPTAADLIAAEIVYRDDEGCGVAISAVTLTGNTLRLSLGSICYGFPPGPISYRTGVVHFGPLPEGRYSFVVYTYSLNGPPFEPPILWYSRDLFVTPDPAAPPPPAIVPVLSPLVLLLLGIALAVIAAVVLRRGI